MKENFLEVVDCHTAGEPARVIVAGLPKIDGKTMLEKKKYFAKNLDKFRRLIINEPRGHKDMFGVILTQPCDNRTDIGALFLDSQGYLNMCGHGTIALVTALLETKLITKKPRNNLVNVIVDTPAGIVYTQAKVCEDKVIEVSFENVPAFVWKEKVSVKIDDSLLSIDICFGGSFFGMVDVGQLPHSLCSENINYFIDLGMKLRELINLRGITQHPLETEIKGVDLIEFYEDLEDTKQFKKSRNLVVFGNGQYDRSPCGTGTCAKLALLYKKKQISLDQVLINQSILGTEFVGQVVRSEKVGKVESIIPRVAGSAYITGFQKMLLDENDPFCYGFEIK
jgi:proline racemase